MSRKTNKYLPFLKRHIWALAAFFIPLAIRSIPEILSWPYLLGLDTQTVVGLIQSGHVLAVPLNIFRYQLFYSVATTANWVIGDSIMLLKIFGPILMGSVALLMYLYARQGLGWNGFKSFFLALLVGTYFVTLRNSWDLYSQSFAIIFLLATLTVLKMFQYKWRYPVAFAFMILTVLSHELISVILLFILMAEGVRYLIIKCRVDCLFSFLSTIIGIGLFFYRQYSPVRGTVVLPDFSVVPIASVDRTLHMTGLLLFCFGLILPFVMIGLKNLKDWNLRYWVFLCLGFVIYAMAFPDTPFYYWNRWVYLLVYPLLFFAVEGLTRLWDYGNNHKNQLKRWIPKIFAILYVAILVVLSGFYLVGDPESQVPFFASDNPYLSYIPSSMLQNTLALRDNHAFVSCANWIDANGTVDSVIVEHYALYNLAIIYQHKKVINVINSPSIWIHLENEPSLVDDLISASKSALDNGNSTVYTIWWINGAGWYKIPSLPTCFKVVYQIDNLAVFSFEP